jgi:hypothetical protein
MLKSLFKQPYKIVSFETLFYLEYLVGSYAPLEAELTNPFPLGQNVFMLPEEQNVIIKKISASFHLDVSLFTTNNHALQNWVVNYQLLNRTDGYINQYPTRVINTSSGDWSVPGTSAIFTGCVNTKHSINNFGPGIQAGGIRIESVSLLGHRPLTSFLGLSSLTCRLKLYYEDLDEKK